MMEREELNQNQPSESLNQESQPVNPPKQSSEQSTDQKKRKKRRSKKPKGLVLDQQSLINFIENIIEERGGKIYWEKGWAMTRCPFHDDEHPSLAINLENGRFHCKACGEIGSIKKLVKALARERGEAFGRDDAITLLIRAGVLKQAKPVVEAIYEYELPPYFRDYKEVAYRKKKLRYPDGRKSFVYEHYDYDKDMWVAGKPKDCPLLLYKRIYVELARETGKPVFFVEGEKDVETLLSLGLYATTSGGANDWHPELAKEFEGMEVVLIPDNDVAGKTWLVKVGSDLLKVARTVKWIDLSEEAKKIGLELKKGADITDFLEALGCNPQDKQDKRKCLQVLMELELKPFDPEELQAKHEEELLEGFDLFWGLEDLQDLNIEFLIEGFLPFGHLTVLTGEAGVGKTFLAYGIAKTAIKKGSKVVYLDADNPTPYIKQLLEDFGLIQELKKRFFIVSRQRVDLSINKNDPHWQELKKLLRGIRPCLVVVDTLGAFTRGYDPNSDKDMREVMSELKGIRDMGHAVLVLHHTQKYASVDDKLPAELKYKGSGVVKSDADNLFYTQREDYTYLLQAGKLRFMGSQVLTATLLESGMIKVELQTSESKEKREARMLLDLIAVGKEYARSEIVELARFKLGFGKNKVDALLKILEEQGVITLKKGEKGKFIIQRATATENELNIGDLEF